MKTKPLTVAAATKALDRAISKLCTAATNHHQGTDSLRLNVNLDNARDGLIVSVKHAQLQELAKMADARARGLASLGQTVLQKEVLGFAELLRFKAAELTKS